MQVVAHHGIPALERDVAQFGGELPAGTVKKPVNAAMLLHDGGNAGLDSGLVADVAHCGADIAGALGVNRRYFRRHGFKLGGLPADQRDMRAQAGQLMRRAPTQPASPACHDDSLAFKQPRAEGRPVTCLAGWAVRTGLCDEGVGAWQGHLVGSVA